MKNTYLFDKETFTAFFKQFEGKKCMVKCKSLLLESYMEGEVYFHLDENIGQIQFLAGLGISQGNDLTERIKEFLKQADSNIKTYDLRMLLSDKDPLEGYQYRVGSIWYTMIKKFDIEYIENNNRTILKINDELNISINN